ncbi:MAG: hypothetical protein HDQ96_15845 [Lachnospiraceae bacterium]|nr:hypothetical protein [Lachnospiraceae bacterium]
MEKKVFVWEPWFFITFGLFHLHRIWGLIDRSSYAGFWIGVLENKGVSYFALMGILAILCILGVTTFVKNYHRNYWWRWIYLFGGMYLLFDLFAIAIGLEFWKKLLLWMFDETSIYWNAVWSFFILLGAFVFLLGIKLLLQRKG